MPSAVADSDYVAAAVAEASSDVEGELSVVSGGGVQQCGVGVQQCCVRIA